MTVMDLSPSWTGPESCPTPLEIELEIPESQTPGNPIPRWGELRIPESLTPGKSVQDWNGKLKPPESLVASMGQAAMETEMSDRWRSVRRPFK